MQSMPPPPSPPTLVPPVPPVPVAPPVPPVPASGSATPLQVPIQLPVQVQLSESPLVLQVPAVQSKLQSAVALQAKLHDCPSLQVALQLESAAQDMLQLDGSASQLFTQVLPAPHASLFPDLAESSSPLQAIKATDNMAATVTEFQKFMGCSVGLRPGSRDEVPSGKLTRHKGLQPTNQRFLGSRNTRRPHDLQRISTSMRRRGKRDPALADVSGPQRCGLGSAVRAW